MSKHESQAGLSMIEMLVVLAVLAIVSGISVPSLLSMRDAAAFRSEAETVLGQVALLGLRARAERRLVTFPGTDGPLLPAGWTSEGDALFFLPTGACLGGMVVLRGPDGRRFEERLDPPQCTFGKGGAEATES